MKADKTIYAVSLEDVMVPVAATLNGQLYDPTGDVVQMAFIPTSQKEPGGGDWKAASWETGGPDKFLAKCLVGPGGAVTLTPGSYSVFVKVADNPEIPVKRAGVVGVI